MKLASNLTLVGLIAGAPSKDPATDPEKNDPVAALADHAFERQNQMRIQIQHWQLGVANSDEIAQRFIKETQARFFESYGFRQSGVSDWCIVRDYFENEKRMMRQESKSEKSLGYHITHEELLEGIGFDDNIVHNGENELYAEMVMEHFHGYGCHCMPDHAHFIFAGGQGPPQDIIDVNCQLLRTCYSCAQIENDHCDAHGVSYSYELNHGMDGHAHSMSNPELHSDPIVCIDKPGSCARRTCECDKRFALHAAELHSYFNHDNHGLAFDRSTQCVKHEGHGAHFQNDCQRDTHRELLVEAQQWPVKHMDQFPFLHAHGDPKSHDHDDHDHGHDHHFKPQRAPTTKKITTTTKRTTTTTTKPPGWHTHPGMPEGHVHPTRARIN